MNDDTAAEPAPAYVPASDPGGPGHQTPAGRHTTDLGGIWEFTTDPETAVWDRLPVPGSWDVNDRYACHQGDGWYRRTFDTPRFGDEQVVRLHFEAVCYTATVWLDGTLLGTHAGGYTPFEYDVTGLLTTDGSPNTLTVRANNDEVVGATWLWEESPGPSPCRRSGSTYREAAGHRSPRTGGRHRRGGHGCHRVQRPRPRPHRSARRHAHRHVGPCPAFWDAEPRADRGPGPDRAGPLGADRPADDRPAHRLV